MGIKAFAAATIEEGIQLRKNGIRGEILILGYTNVKRASDLEKFDLIQTLIDFEYAKALNSQNFAIKVHIKIDTGMHRLGFSCGEFLAVKKVFEMKNLKICGIHTHLCCADSLLPDDIAFTRKQIDNFYHLIDDLKDGKINIPKVHIQSSCGLLNYSDSDYNKYDSYSRLIEQYGDSFEKHTYNAHGVYNVYLYSYNDYICEFCILEDYPDSIYGIDIYAPSLYPIYDYGEKVIG